MLTQYIRAAMAHASYEILPDDSTYYGAIAQAPGVWANKPTLEECRAELESALEDWILLSIAEGLPLPTIDGLELVVKREVA
jgi:predicted RNase H-like HicB family nuclease